MSRILIVALEVFVDPDDWTRHSPFTVSPCRAQAAFRELPDRRFPIARA